MNIEQLRKLAEKANEIQAILNEDPFDSISAIDVLIEFKRAIRQELKEALLNQYEIDKGLRF